MSNTKRIPGIGNIEKNTLNLTAACTRACGHLLPEGVDGGADARAMRDRVRVAAREHAATTGKPVEVWAFRSSAQGWKVDEIEA